MITADWQDGGTKEDLEKRIGTGFVVQLGWTETEHTTIFCKRSHIVGEFQIYVWNTPGPNVRKQLADALAQPVYRR